MKVKVEPNWSSVGKDHNIEDGYMILNVVVKELYIDGNRVDTDTERYFSVKKVIDKSPEKIEMYT